MSSPASDIPAWKQYKRADALQYLHGFNNEFSSEAVEGAYPRDQNTPQKCKYGLIAEQLSGTSFTTPRKCNRKSWVYRQLPSAVHPPFEALDDKSSNLTGTFDTEGIINPNQIRWKPFPLPGDKEATDFVESLSTVGGAGSAAMKSGFAIHVYSCNRSMTHNNTGSKCTSGKSNKSFCNSDGDFLIVPQLGALIVQTEFGKMRVAPGEFCVVQRGMKFAVDLVDNNGFGPARGYICENFEGHYEIPDLGPIGSNGLANPRHFLTPVAYYDGQDAKDLSKVSFAFTQVQKFMGKLFSCEINHSPFNVVGWTGNYVPYKYDLENFCTVNSVSFDHLDPSIFTVLTASTAHPGVACVDFVVFPPRWAVQEHTFRPPYYHKNIMSEFMGNIMGQYDAKPEGFLPGGGSLHSCMMGHGPDADTYKKASTADLKPIRMSDNDLAFMFESTYLMKLTKWSDASERKNGDYWKCWAGMRNEFQEEYKNE